MKEESRETLEAFVAKAQKLRASRFRALAREGFETTFSFEKGKGIKVEYKGPDSESIEAFVLTFRFFIQKRERTSIRSLEEICDDPDVSDAWKKTFHQIRKVLNEYLDTTPPAPEKTPTNRGIMDVFIYGNLAHEEKEKKRQYDEWRARPEQFAFFNHQFNGILVNVLGWITILFHQTREELRGRNMSDVDIELRNAQKDLLAQGREVTVQSLSEFVGGIYGDDLIAGWLSVNPSEGPTN